jgi:hypothetical protein
MFSPRLEVQMHVPEHSRARATNMASGGGAAARMDPEAATELVRKGATLLLLDVPQRTLFGIDAQVGRLSLCSSRIALALLDGLGGRDFKVFWPSPAYSAGVLRRAQVQRDQDGAPGAAFRLPLLPQQVPDVPHKLVKRV